MSTDCPAGIDWSSYQYSEPEHNQDPFPVYDAMLKQRIVRSDVWDGYWILSTHDDVYEAYRTPEIFSSYPNNVPAAEGGGLGASGKLIPLEIDPPEHAFYRRILAEPFGPREVARYGPWMRQRCDELLEPIVEKGRCEFMSEFATTLPGELWCKLMDVPTEDALPATDWATKIMHGDPTQPDGGMDVRIAAMTAAYTYLKALVDARRRNPGDDVVTYLLNAQGAGGRQLTEPEVLNTAMFLLMAGLDTTRGVLGDMVWRLSTRPDLRRRLATDPLVSRAAMEELTRLAAPISPGRTLTRDVEIGGVRMGNGDRVLLMTAAACRDPRAYDDPHNADFDRTGTRHLSFGAGPHRCVGSHLARLELQIALEQIHQKMPDYSIDPDHPVRWIPAPIRAIEELHLIIGP